MRADDLQEAAISRSRATAPKMRVPALVSLPCFERTGVAVERTCCRLAAHRFLHADDPPLTTSPGLRRRRERFLRWRH